MSGITKETLTLEERLHDTLGLNTSQIDVIKRLVLAEIGDKLDTLEALMVEQVGPMNLARPKFHKTATHIRVTFSRATRLPPSPPRAVSTCPICTKPRLPDELWCPACQGLAEDPDTPCGECGKPIGDYQDELGFFYQFVMETRWLPVCRKCYRGAPGER